APPVGSILEVPEDVNLLNHDAKKNQAGQERDFSVLFKNGEDKSGAKFINLIIKADVLGSVGAIIESLAKLETNEIKIKIVGKGLGMIGEADVLKAEATSSKIIGFHVKPATNVENLARDKKVEIKYYEVIYHLIEDIQNQIATMKVKETVRNLIGKLEVIKIFRRENKNMIVGGRVIEGTLSTSDAVIVTRGGEAVSSGKVSRLECVKKPMEKVAFGQECGIAFEGNPIIQEGDVLEFYQEK
ncbi:MAG: hypothetical protein AAB358_04035, partial [Patescibacteria group bacterium]